VRAYRLEDEERVRLDSQLTDWTKAGLLESAQRASLRRDLTTSLRRTGLMLRLGLAIFTFFGGIAASVLVLVVLEVRSDRALAALAALASIAAFTAADRLAKQGRWYRHGVEEALAVSAVVFALTAGVIGLSEFLTGVSDQDAMAMALVLASLVSAACYFRFGLQYASAAAIGFAAAAPMALPGVPIELKHLMAAAICSAVFVSARILRTRMQSDIHEDDAEVISAAALVGAYLSLNLYLVPAWFGTAAFVAPWLRWSTYVLVWIIPPVALWRAVHDRDRTLLRTSLVLALATLVTNKPYLGWSRRPWDPMLLGGLLIAAALLLRKWLSAGEAGERTGFTAIRILPSEDDPIQLAALASAAVHMRSDRPSSDTQSFGQGRSGGGGAQGSF
jgi:hypothetical protein